MAVVNRFKELLAQRERAERRRITYAEIARITGIHESTLSKWANQVGRFDSDTIVALCNYFNCGIEDLLIIDGQDPNARQELAPTSVVA